jgi:hypothetical protein
MSKMVSHEPFEYLQPKLWAKEGLGVKLPVWLLTIKSRESTWSRRLQEECDMALESSQRDLQDCFRPHPNQRSKNAQSLRSVIRDSFGTPLWESREKVPFGCSLGGELQRILYGGRWCLPLSPSRDEPSESKLHMACPNTKGVFECELTLLWLVLDAGSCNNIIVPSPSLIPELLARPSHPL